MIITNRGLPARATLPLSAVTPMSTVDANEVPWTEQSAHFRCAHVAVESSHFLVRSSADLSSLIRSAFQGDADVVNR